MTNKTLTNMISGAGIIARKSRETLKKSSQDYIEQNILKGKYVSREEYEQLHKLVLKLQKKLDDLSR